MQDLMVTKRNGREEKIDLEKIHRVIDWAADGLENVSVSQVELKAQIQFLMVSALQTFTKLSLSLLPI